MPKLIIYTDKFSTVLNKEIPLFNQYQSHLFVWLSEKTSWKTETKSLATLVKHKIKAQDIGCRCPKKCLHFLWQVSNFKVLAFPQFVLGYCWHQGRVKSDRLGISFLLLLHTTLHNQLLLECTITLSYHIIFFILKNFRRNSIFSISVSRLIGKSVTVDSVDPKFINFVFPVWIDSCMINGIAMQWLEGDASTLATVITFVTQSDLNSMYFEELPMETLKWRRAKEKCILPCFLLKKLALCVSHSVCLTLTVDYKQ